MNATSLTPTFAEATAFLPYVPSTTASIFFAVVFLLALIAQVVEGICWRTWSFLFFMFFATTAECMGYLARYKEADGTTVHAVKTAYKIDLTLLTFAPAFISGSIYLTLKHIVLHLGPEFSLLKPALYTWIFVACDIVTILIQAAGAGYLASQASSGGSHITTAKNIVLTGVVLQLVAMTLFFGLAVEFFLRVRSHRHALADSASRLLNRLHFKLFLGALLLSFTCIVIRQIYRVAQFASGRESSLSTNETYFIALDSVMIMISTYCLTLFHPGHLLRQEQKRKKQQASALESKTAA